MSEGNSRGGIGLIGAMTLLFIGLKLAGIIAWSWAWVLSPIWITLLICAIVAITLLALAATK